MATLVQLIIPLFLLWLLWKAFRTPQGDDKRSSGSCDISSGSACGNGPQGGCSDAGGSCDGGGGD